MDIVLRSTVMFAILFALLRLMGKRELNSVSPFELVTLMLIPEVLSNALQQEGELLNGLVGLSTLLLMVLATSILSYSVPGFARVVESEPTVLVAQGKVCQRALDDGAGLSVSGNHLRTRKNTADGVANDAADLAGVDLRGDGSHRQCIQHRDDSGPTCHADPSRSRHARQTHTL